MGKETVAGQKVVIANIRIDSNISRIDKKAWLALFAYKMLAKDFIRTHDPACSACPGMRMHQTLLTKSESILEELKNIHGIKIGELG